MVHHAWLIIDKGIYSISEEKLSSVDYQNTSLDSYQQRSPEQSRPAEITSAGALALRRLSLERNG